MDDGPSPSADSQATCWTVIRDAAAGRADARRTFAGRYEPAIRAYLGARWRHSPLIREIDDAAQDVFLECFRADGALTRVDEERGGFRGFLYGVTRNVARRTEQATARNPRPSDSRIDLRAVEARDEDASRLFDQAWARARIAEARALQVRRAAESGNGALERVEILRLRFERGLPIREIAAHLGVDPARTHHEYAKARREFRQALIDVVREQEDLSVAAAEAECLRLTRMLAS